MHYYGGWMWPMWGLMMVFWLAVIALLVWLAVRYTRTHSNGDDKESARRILAERYARGELDTDEYHHRLDNLR
ncbi:MAG TPA: SHOCT domain-containing protein [Micromonosporaceae bacterium]